MSAVENPIHPPKPTLKAPIAHIHFDEEGRPWVGDTNRKVIEIVLDQLAYGWTPEKIYSEHYSDISMAEIHAALAYYYDNKQAMDAEIQKAEEEVDRLEKEAAESPVQRRLREQGLLG